MPVRVTVAVRLSGRKTGGLQLRMPNYVITMYVGRKYPILPIFVGRTCPCTLQKGSWLMG